MKQVFSRRCVVHCLVLVILFPSCSQKDNQDIQHPMPLQVPANFPLPEYDFAANPVSREGFVLGRTLFYDGKLSRDGSISCGNCHLQANAFTHHGHSVSHGIDDKVGTRNAPAVMNLAWQKFFFWDGGVFNLDLVPLAPIENPLEMDEHMPMVLEKIRNDPKYPPMFQSAFGSPEITTAATLKAMSQFMLQCVSTNSRYDQYKREGAQLTAEEADGLRIFTANCSSCHATDLFTDQSFHNNGLIPSLKNDPGRAKVTLQEKDLYLFKTPSLRNVGITAPYMHDGRFRTLEAVLEHYNSGVVNSETLDTLLKRNGHMGIPLTGEQQVRIIAFLHTLTDSTFIHNKALSEQ
ncbi:cytochrome-c peroxidase [Flavihumibacter fluvii]|uniref:cytochrome-c peroxidase n=1 Tax=Flavihumibacter fluvii TaxID=2838157 RepID=UPI001BDF1711|nr:cytochrome c peroxidase [Flavihumibacter fluvii]ULQ51282.1 cytochrome-c peroxidase [Flavihumibacter fluvii]